MAVPEIVNYEEQVYAGVLGKVIGVYMGRPFEGWRKDDLVAHWGLVDRYVAGGGLIIGTDDWRDYTISSRFAIVLAEAGGLIARYQGLQRFIALVKTRDALKLVRNFYGETVLAETPCAWQMGELQHLALTVRGTKIVAHLEGEEVLRATDDRLACGGAGYLVESGTAGFREFAIEL